MKRRWMLLWSCFVSALVMSCGGGGPDTLSVIGAYIMSFHACDTATGECANPSGHTVYVAQSDDGVSWSLVPDFVPRQGSVPDLIRRGDTLYVFLGANTVQRYRFDTGRWDEAKEAEFKYADGSNAFFTDITPIVDDDGRIVLFFFEGGTAGVDPASCTDLNNCPRAFLSATEVDGSDGMSFVVDAGVRYAGNGGSDPDIFKGPGGYVLYISSGQNVRATTSSTLRGTYTEVSGLPDGLLVANDGGVPSGHYDAASGNYWTYVHKNSSGGLASILRAVHPSLSQQLSESDFATVLDGSTVAGLSGTHSVESPGFAVNTD